MRKFLPALLLVIPLAAGCAGPAKLTQKSQEKLAAGDPWRAWTLATKALDKAPGHPGARAAATQAAGAIADDWRRRIHALAETDSIAAAEQMLEFTTFRTSAARYATVPVPAGWPDEERALRASAAHVHYQRGMTALERHRPKNAYQHFIEVGRFVPDYRGAAGLADRALEQGMRRVAFVPLRSKSVAPSICRDVAASWRGDAAEHLAPPTARFTRILPVEDVERHLKVSDLGSVTREQAIRLGRWTNADRVVWGSIGNVESKTSLHTFSDAVARRVVEKDTDGKRTTHWVDVPIEVIARVRTVSVPVEYEVIDTRTGATLARHSDPCTKRARVVWTSYQPEGDPGSYALVSDPARTADPKHARQVESRWKDVAGEGTSLAQVLEAKRESRNDKPDRHEVLARFMAGAAFVMLQELPSADDLAYAALAADWNPVYQDLLRMDGIDDADLGLRLAGDDGR